MRTNCRDPTEDTVSEWLRRWTRNPLGSARKGSNPFGVDACLSQEVQDKCQDWRCRASARMKE